MPGASAENISHKFNRINTLPPLPRTATQLLEVLADPEVEIEAVAKIIDQDPALVARILGLANSAFFGQVNEITEVRQAIIRVLGINLVKSLALSISLARAFDTRACKAFDVADYWYTALGSAAMTRTIVRHAPDLRSEIAEGAYLIALLHNLGVLLLAAVMPQEMSSALEQYRQEPALDLLEIERDRVGIDHLEAGEWLLGRWHLPDLVVEVVGQMGNADYQGAYWQEWVSVRTAVELVSIEKSEKTLQLSSDSDTGRILKLDETGCTAITEQYLMQVDALRQVAQALN